MKIEIGPVSRVSARAWLVYTRDALETLRRTSPARAPVGALDAFEELLGEWGDIVAQPGDFFWSQELAPARVEYLLNALYEAGLAIEEQHEIGLAELRPAETDEFHLAVVNQVLAALEHEGEASAQFVEMLRGVWGIAGI